MNPSNDIKSNYDLGEYSTFGISGTARKFAHLTSITQIPELVSKAKQAALPVLPLGEGSNTVFTDSVVSAVCVDINLTGINVSKRKGGILVEVSAGENWDALVQKTVKAGLTGIEALSAIPGSVGAAPVQNIGAYGQELSHVLESVSAYDTDREQFVTLSPEACNFGYRTSVFKQYPGRFIITEIVIKLSEDQPDTPDYPDVKDYFSQKQTRDITPKDIRQAVVEIRDTKLPDPKKTPNVGSFFKNPVVRKSHARSVRECYPDMPSYQKEDGMKIPAGWMIDTLGFKGQWCGTVGVHERNALVLVSEPEAEFADLQKIVAEIREAVNDAFGITLEREPRLYGKNTL